MKKITSGFLLIYLLFLSANNAYALPTVSIDQIYQALLTFRNTVNPILSEVGLQFVVEPPASGEIYTYLQRSGMGFRFWPTIVRDAAGAANATEIVVQYAQMRTVLGYAQLLRISVAAVSLEMAIGIAAGFATIAAIASIALSIIVEQAAFALGCGVVAAFFNYKDYVLSLMNSQIASTEGILIDAGKCNEPSHPDYNEALCSHWRNKLAREKELRDDLMADLIVLENYLINHCPSWVPGMPGQKKQLTVLKAMGAATVKDFNTPTPESLRCGSGQNICDGYYRSGSTVTLQAIEDTGSKFSEWNNCAPFFSPSSPNAHLCKIKMDEDSTVRARFVCKGGHTELIAPSGNITCIPPQTPTTPTPLTPKHPIINFNPTHAYQPLKNWNLLEELSNSIKQLLSPLFIKNLIFGS